MQAEDFESFRSRRRQRFLDPENFEACFKFIEPATKARERTLAVADGENDTDFANLSRVAGDIAEDKFFLFSLRYTAGESPDKLRHDFEGVIAAYERYAKYDRQYHEEPRMPLFDFNHIDDYVRMLALLSIAILLRRDDLIPRIHELIADSAFDGQDAVYEELLTRFLPHRPYLDEWYHELPYRYLLDVTGGESAEERIADMQSYLKNWYKYMKGCGWYDSHKNQGPEGGGYFGYWAWEAAAVAYLYDLDDTSFRDHLVYPKDLVAFARQHAPLDQEQLPAQYRVLPGEPCPKTGEWMVGHTPRTARRFTKGEMMPELNLDTGATIWMFVRD